MSTTTSSDSVAVSYAVLLANDVFRAVFVVIVLFVVLFVAFLAGILDTSYFVQQFRPARPVRLKKGDGYTILFLHFFWDDHHVTHKLWID